MALSNSLDLRPATAAPIEQRLSGGTASRQSRFGFVVSQINTDSEAFIKETDLGGLSSALFTPNASQIASAQAALMYKSSDNINLSTSPQTVSKEANSSRLASWMTSVGCNEDTMSKDTNKVKAATEHESPKQHDDDEYWATKAHHEPSLEPDQAEETQSSSTSRGTRQIQSARPVTRNGQELDSSVWKSSISVQVQKDCK
jgi:hypothetical protein